jgi:hypothetical protein
MKVASIGIKTSRSVRRGDLTSCIGIASNSSQNFAADADAAAADLADGLEIAQALVLGLISGPGFVASSSANSWSRSLLG